MELNPATQKLSLDALGDLKIWNVPSAFESRARSELEDRRESAIAQANGEIDTALTGAVDMNDILRSFDSSGSASFAYSSVEVRQDGIVLRGRISLAPRPPVVVHFSETTDGTTLTAFKSWIPGGTVERYVWEWQKVNEFTDEPHSHPGGPFTSHQAVHDDHGFLTPVPDPMPADGWICLRVEGTQMPSSSGPEYPVSAETCHLLWLKLLLAVPPAWPTVPAAPLFGASEDRDAVLESTLIGHVDAFSRSRTPADIGLNTIVHFAEVQSPVPLDTIGRALAERSRRDAHMGVVLVLPPGSLRERRSLIDERIDSVRRQVPSAFVITEDYESGWSRTFGVQHPPATFLVDGRGNVVWHEEELRDIRALAAALDRHSLTSPRPPSRAVRIAARPGDRAADVLFADEGGQRVALRKLRGRRALLMFWKSWSAPCLAMLDHLQQISGLARGRGPTVLAINDGEDLRRVAEVRRERNLTVTLIPDPERTISKTYGVHCWPTTISIDESGRVDRVHVGLMREAALTRHAITR